MSFRRPQFRPFARVITALAGILLMLAGEAPLIAFSAQAAMDCCPDGHACCRRLRHGAHHNGATLQGDFCGMPGCGGGALNTVSIPLHAGAAQAVQLQLVTIPQLLVILFFLSFAVVQFTPELFQRPPPFVL